MVDPVINDLAEHIWKEGQSAMKEEQRAARLEALKREYLETHTLWDCLGESCGVEGDKAQKEDCDLLMDYVNRHLPHKAYAAMNRILDRSAESWVRLKLWAEEENAKRYGGIDE